MGIEDTISKHKRLMIDTAPVIYYIEEHKYFSPLMNKIFIENEK